MQGAGLRRHNPTAQKAMDNRVQCNHWITTHEKHAKSQQFCHAPPRISREGRALPRGVRVDLVGVLQRRRAQLQHNLQVLHQHLPNKPQNRVSPKSRHLPNKTGQTSKVNHFSESRHPLSSYPYREHRPLSPDTSSLCLVVQSREKNPERFRPASGAAMRVFFSETPLPVPATRGMSFASKHRPRYRDVSGVAGHVAERRRPRWQRR